MSKASVTAIVPTFNRAHLLGACIESLLGQAVRPEQILVIDDGSTDSTRNVVDAFRDNVEYVVKPNGGKSSALNRAAQHVRGTHVWIMDDDDIALPSALRDLLVPHAEDPTLGYSFGSCVNAVLDEQNRPSRTLKKMPATYDDSLHLYRLCGNNYVFLNACLIQRDAFVATGAFDERLIRSQDYDFLLRLTRRARFRHISSQVYWLREHEGVRGTQTEIISHHQRSSAWRRYDRILGEKLFAYCQDSWFVHPALSEVPDDERRRAVAIRKAFVAASKGLVERVPAFLEEAADCCPGRPLHEQDQLNIGALFDDRDFVDAMAGDPAYRSMLRSTLGRLPGCSLRTLLARRLYWDARIRLSSDRHAEGLQLLFKATTSLLRWN